MTLTATDNFPGCAKKGVTTTRNPPNPLNPNLLVQLGGSWEWIGVTTSVMILEKQPITGLKLVKNAKGCWEEQL